MSAKGTGTDIENIERKAKGLNYQQMDEVLRDLPNEVLLRLLDSRSIKVGDTAADILGRRNQSSILIDAILQGQIRTSVGRTRAKNTLAGWGASLPEAIPAYMKLLDDRSDEVVGGALHALLFFRYQPALKVIEAQLASVKPGTRRYEYLDKARRAFQAGDPFIYSPGYAREPARKLWRLDEPPIPGIE